MARVLGIDPGLRITGYGLVELPGFDLPAAEADGAAQPHADVAASSRTMPTNLLIEPRLCEAGVIRLNGRWSSERRLVQLHNDLCALLDEFKPTRVAVEKLYAHYRHPRTAILMAHARGVILLCAQQRSVPIVHLPATEVKKAVTGHGHASKQQMQRAVAAQCNLPEPPSPPDVADAIAIALTLARRLTLGAAGGSW